MEVGPQPYKGEPVASSSALKEVHGSRGEIFRKNPNVCVCVCVCVIVCPFRDPPDLAVSPELTEALAAR